MSVKRMLWLAGLILLVVSKSSVGQAVKVEKLEVRIITEGRRGAGTDNTVYFDIGPLAWKLNKGFHNDFESGDDDTYLLKTGYGLTTDDILWLRLHKKGVGGVTGTKDGLFGAWHPKSVTLLVNGVEFKSVQVDHALNSSCWYWRSPVSTDSGLSLLAHSLRIKANKNLNFLDKTTGFLTTNAFKEHGISGWLPDPVSRECPRSKNLQLNTFESLCVTGQVIAKGRSTDGIETIDIKVARIQSCSTDNQKCPDDLLVDTAHGFAFERYIRIENRHAHNRVKVGMTARICGELRWDTDRQGWWEIHPRNDDDLPPKF
jgi:hypothetical protein